MRTIAAIVAPAILAVILGGCSSSPLEPYYIGRWSPNDDSSKLEIPSYVTLTDRAGKPYLHVCYNRAFHSPKQIHALVSKNCFGGELVENTSDIYTCSLAAPIRATYRCDSLSRAAAEARVPLRKDDTATGELEFDTFGSGSSQ